MTPNSSHTRAPTVRVLGKPAPASQRQFLHGSALPLLVTIATTIILSFAIIVLAAGGVFASLEVAAVLIA